MKPLNKNEMGELVAAIHSLGKDKVRELALLMWQHIHEIDMESSGKSHERWIACSERMPELDKRVLLYFGSYDGHIEDGCIGDDGDGPYHYFFDGDSLQQEPTHWMPLPESPTTGK